MNGSTANRKPGAHGQSRRGSAFEAVANAAITWLVSVASFALILPAMGLAPGHAGNAFLATYFTLIGIPRVYVIRRLYVMFSRSPQQSRLSSLSEAITNILAGYGIAVFSLILLLPALGVPVEAHQSVEIALYFTLISLIRSYVIRRAFARMGVPPARTETTQGAPR